MNEYFHTQEFVSTLLYVSNNRNHFRDFPREFLKNLR